MLVHICLSNTFLGVSPQAREWNQNKTNETILNYKDLLGTDIYTLLCVKYITNENLLYHREVHAMLCGDRNGKEILKRGNMCMCSLDLTGRTSVGKGMSLLFNMLSRLVITFLPRSERLFILWLQSPSAVILEPKNIKSAAVSTVSQGYGFSSSHVWMWELDHKESWAPKNWCFWTVVLEKTLESPFDCKEIQLVHPKENQSLTFIGKIDAEAETPILWPPDVKSLFIGKDPDAGKDWRWEEKGTIEDEMVEWHHPLNGHEFE